MYFLMVAFKFENNTFLVLQIIQEQEVAHLEITTELYDSELYAMGAITKKEYEKRQEDKRIKQEESEKNELCRLAKKYGFKLKEK